MRILVIEDDEFLRAEICEYLKRRRHDVLGCATLAEGRSVARQHAATDGPEAILCDVNLADGNGVEFCLETAAVLPNRRWILMSGGHSDSQVARLDGIDADIAIVDKPVRIKELENLLTGGAHQIVS